MELLRNISIYAFLLAIVSYLFGVTGLATLGTSIEALTTYSYLPVFAFLFIFMAILLDDSDILPFYYRIFTVFLYLLSLIALYHFFEPVNFMPGEMITPLLYSLVVTFIAIMVMPFMRDSFLVRIATMVMFAFAAISIWLYQGSGNAYSLLNMMPPKALVEYQVNKEGLSDKAVKLLEDTKETSFYLATSYKDLDELAPSERRKVFVERLKKNYSLENKEKIESLIWNFALTESFAKFKYYYKTQNLFFFILKIN